MAIIGTGRGAGKMILIMIIVVIGFTVVVPRVQAWRGKH